ncbi:MAG: signal peptidase II [Pseudomonadota bacterium]
MKKISLVTAIVIVIIDQISKYAAVKYLSHIKLEVTSFFNLALVYNKGISFGLFNNLPYSNYVFLGVSSLIVGYLIKWIRISKYTSEIMGLALIIGGAIGNIIDRFIYPGVVDFLEFHWHEYYWPSFNIADASICIGVILLLLFNICYTRAKNKREECLD